MLRFLQLCVALVPLGLFSLVLEPVQLRLYGGHATQGILWLLAALAALAVVEGLLFRYWILPDWSDKMAERLYAGSYLPENDALATLVEQIARDKDTSQLPRLENLVLQQPSRLRGWLEYARLQHELLHDAAAALMTLDKACSHVRAPEDVALLMYRAALLCQKSLHDPAQSRNRLLLLVQKYPATVYGRRAADLLQ
ncbi:MAG: hypothetical protein IKA23_08515 [Akkermansia sp.]|nr:hypothetical protein [Akkermansia sp.]